MSGNFEPHVRMMKTGFEDVELAKKFGLPYVVIRKTRPYDTTTLNYNWQIWETHAFSIYTTTTESIDKESAKMAVRSILMFLAKEGVEVVKGQVLAETIDPYEGAVTEILTAPADGIVFFAHNEPLTYANTAVFKLIEITL